MNRTTAFRFLQRLAAALLLPVCFSPAYAETLSEWTTRSFKALPEFVGKPNKHHEAGSTFFYNTKTRSLSEFYYVKGSETSEQWDDNPYTLKEDQLLKAVKNYISFSKTSPDFKSSAWTGGKCPFTDADFNTKAVPGEEVLHPYMQKAVVPDGSRICLVGDLHGSFHSLARSLWRLLLQGCMDNQFKLADNFYLVFLGDYSDRGVGTAELWYTLINLKLQNPDRVFLLRGNHDSWNHHLQWGTSTFTAELVCKYGKDELDSFKPAIMQLYNLLPAALLIGTDNDFIICAHGGIDPDCKEAVSLIDNPKARFIALSEKYKTDESGNLFLWRWYYDDKKKEKNIVEKDVNALKSNYSVSDGPWTRAIFRGHQHSDMETPFCILKKGSRLGEDMAYLLPSWKTIPRGDQNSLTSGNYKLNNSTYYPLYTLVSATGNYTKSDSYVIVSTAKDFDNWTMRLFTCDINLGPKVSYPAKTFIKIDLDRNDDGNVHTTYSDRGKPYDKPVSDSLMQKAGR